MIGVGFERVSIPMHRRGADADGPYGQACLVLQVIGGAVDLRLRHDGVRAERSVFA